ncbi:MAG TPA: septal ring lytic transglycosylase RlpA family protein [Terriglobia bacterium]|nr:septal ring lytic transglycosylase RlpA family protein [Terriglobia bacterium]
MRNLMIGCAVAAVVFLSAKSEAHVPTRYVNAAPVSIVPLNLREVGLASWYGLESAGTTASGEPYDLNQLTAAHRTLPLNSRIRVTNLKNGRSVMLRINDRGPNVRGRLLDVSRAAAERLGFVNSGKTRVQVTVMRYPKGYIAQPRSLSLLPSCAAPNE